MANIELKIGDKTYNRKWVDDISSTSQISTDPAGINYGVIPSTGNAKLRDVDGGIRADIENGVLPVSNAATSVIINGKQVQEHITSDGDYDVIDRELNLQFSDRLSLLDTVNYAGMPLRDYSMTAYEMLDDVIGSYTGYIKNKVINWEIYSGSDKFIKRGASNSITAQISPLLSGTPLVVGVPVKVAKNKKYSINYSISTNNDYTVSVSGRGIAVQIWDRKPPVGNYGYVTQAYLSTSTSTNIGTLDFTPKTNIVYFVLFFGYANTNQSISVSINSLRIDDWSLNDATSKYYERKPTILYGDFVGYSDTIAEHLSEIVIKYPYLPKASFRETIEKFCTVGQLTCALNENGKFEFFCAKPIRRNDDVVFAVPNKYKISNLNKTIFLKNKIDGVSISYNAVAKEDVSGVFAASKKFSSTNYTRYTEVQTGGSDTVLNSFNELYYVKNVILTAPTKLEQNTIDINKIDNVHCICYGRHTIQKATGFDYDTGKYTYETISEADETWEIPMPLVPEAEKVTNFSQWINMGSSPEFGYRLTADNSIECTITKAYTGQKYQYKPTTNYEVHDEICHTYIASSFTIELYAGGTKLTFTETDCSSDNIDSANTPTQVQTNELIQEEETATSIRDNILDDYKNGVSTASIDLFCGLNDWENGEIIQPNDVLTIDGENGYWRVTGRTFKYNGSPTLSLELQEQKTKDWHYLTGHISSGTISTGDFTANGTKTGTITLPKDDYSAHTTGFTVTVNFKINGDTKIENGAGFNSVKVSKYNALGIHTCNCYIDANWSTGTITYTADEKYNKRAGVARKSYVESITIDEIEQFY